MLRSMCFANPFNETTRVVFKSCENDTCISKYEMKDFLNYMLVSFADIKQWLCIMKLQQSHEFHSLMNDTCLINKIFAKTIFIKDCGSHKFYCYTELSFALNFVMGY